jgi:hypothetical protein
VDKEAASGAVRARVARTAFFRSQMLHGGALNWSDENIVQYGLTGICDLLDHRAVHADTCRDNCLSNGDGECVGKQTRERSHDWKHCAFIDRSRRMRWAVMNPLRSARPDCRNVAITDLQELDESNVEHPPKERIAMRRSGPLPALAITALVVALLSPMTTSAAWAVTPADFTLDRSDSAVLSPGGVPLFDFDTQYSSTNATEGYASSSGFVVSAGLMGLDVEADRMAAVAGPGWVQLLLPDTGGSPITIEQGGVVIASNVVGPRWNDLSIPENLISTAYDLTADVPVPESEWPSLLTPEEIAMVQQGGLEAPKRGNSWHLLVSMPSGSPNTFTTLVGPGATLRNSSVVAYRAFIPEATVPAPPWPVCQPGPGEFRFRGDNRTYSNLTTAPSRAAVTMNVNWVSRTASWSRSVGTTIREQKVNGVWKVNATNTASSNGITVTHSLSARSGLYNAHMKIDVKNPMCPDVLVLPVYAELDFSLSRAGSYTVKNGLRRPAPNHEMTVNGYFVIMKASKGLACLTGINFCGYESLNTSGTKP